MEKKEPIKKILLKFENSFLITFSILSYLFIYFYVYTHSFNKMLLGSNKSLSHSSTNHLNC